MDTRIGKQLTQAREALGLIVEDVAHRTRIPATVVRQLEGEDFSQFPNNVYAKSFLRLYSRHLGIDPAPFIAAHDGRLQKREDEVAFLEGMALSPEFRPDEAILAGPSAVPTAAAMPSPVRVDAPAGKISSGFMTMLLLLVVGVPTAFLLSKLYDGDEGDDSGEAGAGARAEVTVSGNDPDPDLEAPVPAPDPGTETGETGDTADAVAETPPSPEGETAAPPVVESTTLNPPVGIPPALTVGGDADGQPRAALPVPSPPAEVPSAGTLTADPVAGNTSVE